MLQHVAVLHVYLIRNICGYARSDGGKGRLSFINLRVITITRLATARSMARIERIP